MRILIVDDEKGFVQFLEERLKGRGVTVDAAYDGKSALELVKAKSYGIAFLDHNMPELTGLELVSYIKKNKPGTKTVIVSGYEELGSSFAKMVGADEYLSKPVKIEDVEKIVEKYHGFDGRSDG